ncbi:uncharacterized protein LOC128513885 [Clarias gariepinus]|uniref:uncharacterized protein LOC128513885 n=1 Tax=Clarias gariepinus TaxID=13013 RepID=UPI00234DF492|nr:uncharacterized protein LOC128513885 [Clarias gariepinus]
MKAYEPWERGGAGSRFRDDRGNLITRTHYSAVHYSSVAEQKEREELEFMRKAGLQHQPEPAQANHRHRNLHHKPDRQLSQHGIYSSGIGSYPSDSHHCPKEHVENYRDELKQQAELAAEMKAYEPRGGEETWAPLMVDQGNLIIFSFTQPLPHAKAKFSKLQMLQHLLEQEKDRESLKQQIEEKQMMTAERRERLRLGMKRKVE